MGVLKNITEEYFGESARQENGKFIDIGGCKVLVPTEYDEFDFLYKADDVIVSMYAIVTEEKKDDDEFVSFKCGNGKWWMNIESYDYFRKNTTKIEDHDENMHASIAKFLEYFLKDVDIVKYDVYNECVELLNEKKYDEFKSLFVKEGLREKTNYYTVELIYQFVNEWSSSASFSRDNIKWHSAENNDNICIEIRNNFGHLNTYTIRWIKDMVEWWDKKLELIKEKGVREYFNIK